MIQVCSRCGTRWNVRDRQRVWCPRCQGQLLAPTSEAPRQQQQWDARPANVSAPGAPRSKQQLPAGYRWIAVRPGAAPPARRVNRPLGPTPRYAVVPRWGLQDHFDLPLATAPPVEARTASPRLVRVTLVITLIALGVAAVVHIARYALLLINRSTLLSPLVAGIATWVGVAASVVAFLAMIASIVVLANWLISRRAAAYALHDSPDPRPVWQLWVGCLVPIANLFWAPVFVIELARFEGRLSRLRGTIAVWWCAWWVSALISLFSIVTSFTSDAQGIANNTVATTIAYLAALAALLFTRKVYGGFERRPVDRPVKRWVIVADESPLDHVKPEVAEAEVHDAVEQSDVAVESKREEPAA